MTIDAQMKFVVNELISKYGLHYKVSSKELRELMANRFQRNEKSVIPSDYCYNRTNKGLAFIKKPRLLSFLGNGMYECLGEDYSFSGAVYACEKGSKTDIPVGAWENGVFRKGCNWDSCKLQL